MVKGNLAVGILDSTGGMAWPFPSSGPDVSMSVIILVMAVMSCSLLFWGNLRSTGRGDSRARRVGVRRIQPGRAGHVTIHNIPAHTHHSVTPQSTFHPELNTERVSSLLPAPDHSKWPVPENHSKAP